MKNVSTKPLPTARLRGLPKAPDGQVLRSPDNVEAAPGIDPKRLGEVRAYGTLAGRDTNTPPLEGPGSVKAGDRYD